jgi:hypothetical protein
MGFAQSMRCLIFWTGLGSSLADAAGWHADDPRERKGRMLKDVMASAKIPAKHNGLCRIAASGTMEDPQDSRSFQSVSELLFGIVQSIFSSPARLPGFLPTMLLRSRAAELKMLCIMWLHCLEMETEHFRTNWTIRFPVQAGRLWWPMSTATESSTFSQPAAMEQVPSCWVMVTALLQQQVPSRFHTNPVGAWRSQT